MNEKLNLFQANKEFDQNRMENSIKCCELLKEYFEKHPQIRFWQALEIIQSTVYGDRGMFYEEPEDTYLKLKEFVK
jgi:hypothetical protein